MTDDSVNQLMTVLNDDGTATIRVSVDGEETFAWRGSVADFAPVAQQAIQSQLETYAEIVAESESESDDQHEQSQTKDISPPTATPE